MATNSFGRGLAVLVAFACGAACSGKTTGDQTGTAPPGGAAGGTGGASPVASDAQPEGASGGSVVAPEAGTNGASCISGGAHTEADGSTAQTEIQIPDRCARGLTCDATGRCVPMPECSPSSPRDCVVHGTPGTGGAGGAGGAGTGGSGPTAGSGPASTVGDESGIMELAADDARLYFIDYGTRDSLGNYNDDGSLEAFAFADAATTTIASGLRGPLELGVTTSHAYVGVDGGGLVGGQAHPQIVRFPLAGGPSELVLDTAEMGNSGYCQGCFVSAGAIAIWTGDPATYSMAPSAGATPAQLLAEGGWSLATDGTSLYYNPGTALFRIPLGGGAPEQLVAPPYAFGVNGDYVYGIEAIDNETGVMLDRVSKDGGSWTRVRALGAGGLVTRQQLVGDRYFFDEHPPETGPYQQPDGSKIDIVTGSLVSTDPPVRLLERAVTQTRVDRLWTGTARALYWSDGRAIYSRSIPGVP